MGRARRAASQCQLAVAPTDVVVGRGEPDVLFPAKETRYCGPVASRPRTAPTRQVSFRTRTVCRHGSGGGAGGACFEPSIHHDGGLRALHATAVRCGHPALPSQRTPKRIPGGGANSLAKVWAAAGDGRGRAGGPPCHHQRGGGGGLMVLRTHRDGICPLGLASRYDSCPPHARVAFIEHISDRVSERAPKARTPRDRSGGRWGAPLGGGLARRGAAREPHRYMAADGARARSSRQARPVPGVPSNGPPSAQRFMCTREPLGRAGSAGASSGVGRIARGLRGSEGERRRTEAPMRPPQTPGNLLRCRGSRACHMGPPSASRRALPCRPRACGRCRALRAQVCPSAAPSAGRQRAGDARARDPIPRAASPRAPRPLRAARGGNPIRTLSFCPAFARVSHQRRRARWRCSPMLCERDLDSPRARALVLRAGPACAGKHVSMRAIQPPWISNIFQCQNPDLPYPHPIPNPCGDAPSVCSDALLADGCSPFCSVASPPTVWGPFSYPLTQHYRPC